jgi:AICAR transformylase/IMP cyclohydrolase PurH
MAENKNLAAEAAKELGTTTADLLKEGETAATLETVKFKVSYPKDFKGTKHFKDDSVINVHPITGEQFEKRGIGKMVK